MIGIKAYKTFIWGLFTLGWIGVAVILVFSVKELKGFFSSLNSKTR